MFRLCEIHLIYLQMNEPLKEVAMLMISKWIHLKGVLKIGAKNERKEVHLVQGGSIDKVKMMVEQQALWRNIIAESCRTLELAILRTVVTTIILMI